MSHDHDPRESDSKGATEEDTQKISSIDSNDALGNEHASEEHTGKVQDRDEEE